jgi:hypothetical protein
MNSADTPATAAEGLLEEGARSYLDALTALAEFNRQVQSACRLALEAKRGELAGALGVSLAGQPLADAAPAFDKFTGERASVGVWTGVPGTWGKCKQYLTADWDREENGSPWFGISATMWFDNKAAAPGLLARFQERGVTTPHQLWGDGWRVALFEPLAPTEARRLDERLRGLLDAWIDLWRRVGGGKAITTSSE